MNCSKFGTGVYAFGEIEKNDGVPGSTIHGKQLARCTRFIPFIKNESLGLRTLGVKRTRIARLERDAIVVAIFSQFLSPICFYRFFAT